MAQMETQDSLNGHHISLSMEPEDSIEPVTNQSSILQMLDEISNNHLPPPLPHQICIEFHPSANMPPKFIPTHQYNPNSYQTSPTPHSTSTNPWHPFRTRLDFEVAELALSSHMNRQQKQILLTLIDRIKEKPEQFTIDSVSELEKTWELARSYRSTGFQKKEYLVPYQNDEIGYEVYIRPLIEWCNSLLQNPSLLSQFHWIAERHYKQNDGKRDRLIGEPWTANEWWSIQNLLPNGALPFFIILYADKTRLSTFGTAKAYPVLARCANLPANLRNSDGIGGGILVGWLPIVDEDAGESGKKIFVNFKRIVWHKGFHEILKSVQEYATTGYYAQCADNIVRWLFFFILILSADYEEQCVMALTRGATSNFPCPVCLVPKENLSNLTTVYPYRTSAEMKHIYTEAQNFTAKDKENYLKEYGLRNVENVFWMMNGSDVYKALSWDRLHAYHGGLFSDHLWSEFKAIIDSSGRKDAEIIDNQFDQIPRWSGLNHFASIIKTGEFADGTKYEDIAKIICYASHNVLEKSDRGYCLLKLMRSFVELDMYSSLIIHSSTTLHGLQKELAKFCSILEEYIQLHPDKNWNFPKIHSHVHMIQDIVAKGATRNSNTKPNEKAHGLLKLWYRFHTNFKDILKMNHDDLIAMIIRMDINAIDDLDMPKEDGEESLISTPQVSNLGNSLGNGSSNEKRAQSHISIGSLQAIITFADVEKQFKENMAFERFRIKTGKYLAAASGSTIRLKANHKITPFELARIHYQSEIDWSAQRDMVRVSKSFHKRPRNDYVLLALDHQKYCFAQLLFMFIVSLDDKTEWPLALILPLDEPVDQRTNLARRRDKDLEFLRVRARRRTNSAIIDVRSIVRGGLLIPDFGNDANEFIVMDSLDPDMWWRSVAGESSISGASFFRGATLAELEQKQRCRIQQDTIFNLESKVRELKEENASLKMRLINKKGAVRPAVSDTSDCAAEIALRKDLIRLAKYHFIFYRIIVPKSLFGNPRPSFSSNNASARYKDENTSKLGNIAELYECFPAKYHSIISENVEMAVNVFVKGLSEGRSTILNKIRTSAPSIFPNIPSELFTSPLSFGLSSHAVVQTLLGASDRVKVMTGTKEIWKLIYPNDTAHTFPPVLFADSDTNNALGLFKSDFLLKTARIILLGPSALKAEIMPRTREDSPSAHIDSRMNCTTPGLIAASATATIYILSDDREFTSSGVGPTTGRLYLAQHDMYKHYLITQQSSLASLFKYWDNILFPHQKPIIPTSITQQPTEILTSSHSRMSDSESSPSPHPVYQMIANFSRQTTITPSSTTSIPGPIVNVEDRDTDSDVEDFAPPLQSTRNLPSNTQDITEDRSDTDEEPTPAAFESALHVTNTTVNAPLPVFLPVPKTQTPTSPPLSSNTVSVPNASTSISPLEAPVIKPKRGRKKGLAPVQPDATVVAKTRSTRSSKRANITPL
uniref:Uncharacterized protein n=1 Tax=Psilocybe cubensis TaxID=181762 RepID=A0A8H8CLW5_PSICU